MGKIRALLMSFSLVACAHPRSPTRASSAAAEPSRAILMRAGWQRADDAAREKIATDYVREIAETFGGDDPSLERRADGTFVVRIGVSVGPGMNGETSSWTVEYRITARGEVTRMESS